MSSCFLLIFNGFLLLTLRSCSLHGLIRGENMELGRDSDTGGQVIILPCVLTIFLE